jgi:hypothetical protein
MDPEDRISVLARPHAAITGTVAGSTGIATVTP